MDSLFKLFGLFFIAIVITFTGFSFIISLLQISNARDFHNAVIAELETSDFSTTAIQKIQNQEGYKVTLKSVGVYDEKRAYEVKTTYTVSIPILGQAQTDTLTGYAR